ncbi:hypothetical protein Ait01nite_024070 [Actinoplanes italicus]|uniref:Uncharacterized protein n=1 Tax=Actinoplanes italicus TaxID=113567 RepID=A0A2T0KFR6_9ACTN|nr:hypothetical protein [Actinoplanes italicus]PRX22217.1 hypothetical protein CLV67_105394 [Actinoplanes italicus]GIE29362.1 hypothetical protein Ait01nite_024070 [Actinoplanes italicus]
MRLRFEGWIAGLGTAGGTRLVVGHWPGSPFGPVTDVMIEDRAGHRLLFAESEELAQFVAETYSFDEVRVVPFTVRREPTAWTVTAGPLTLRFTTGGRGPLGLLLRAVPAALARQLWWVRLIDLPARMLHGVRTFGSAGNGRREWYAVRDLHRITAADAVLDGAGLGSLTDVHPPVRFGFGSTPPSPALVRITTTVEVPHA